MSVILSPCCSRLPAAVRTPDGSAPSSNIYAYCLDGSQAAFEKVRDVSAVVAEPFTAKMTAPHASRHQTETH